MVADHQLHNMIKKFLYTIAFCLLTQASFAAGDDSSSDDKNYLDQYPFYDLCFLLKQLEYSELSL